MRVDRDLVLARSWEHVGLAHSQIAPDSCSNKVGRIGVVDGNDVRLVLSWSWLVQVLAHEVNSFDAHVELRFIRGLVEVRLNHVVAGAGHVYCFDHIATVARSNRNHVFRDVGWVQRVVGLRPNYFFWFLVLIHMLLCVLLYHEAWNSSNYVLLIGIWSRHSVILQCFVTSSTQD